MKKHIIPIILAIFIILLVVKGTNNETNKEIKPIHQTKQDSKPNIEKTEGEVKKDIIPKKEDIEKPKEDRLMVNCESSFKECKRIGIKKYGVSISLSETGKFYDKKPAEEFYNTWSSFLGIGQELELDYPIVLFAFSMRKGGIQLPDVVICENGELTEISKMKLGC